MIGDLLRQRGYEVDDWHIDVKELKDLRGFGPIEHDFSKARTVLGLSLIHISEPTRPY